MKHIAHQTQYAIVLQSRRRGCQPGSGPYDHIVSQTAQQHDHLLDFKTLLVPLADAQTLLVPFERGLYSPCTGYLAHPSSKMPTSPSLYLPDCTGYFGHPFSKEPFWFCHNAIK
jgi:hypothetical protein